MKKKLLLGLILMCSIFYIMACAKDAVVHNNKETKGKMDNKNISVIGNVVEVLDDSYIFRLMGTGKDGVDVFLITQNRSEILNRGDEVLILLKGELNAVNEDEEILGLNKIAEFTEFVTTNNRCLYTAEIDKIIDYENDGVFEGKLGGIYNQYDEKYEKIIRTMFEIEPNDNEPEIGFFKVDTLMVPKHKTMGSSVTVTYDKETFEVISIE